MKYIPYIVITILFFGCKNVEKANIKYTNAYIFDGTRFKKLDFSVKNGIFLLDPHIQADTIIDLKDQYVIPPFGDAHTHNFLSAYDLDEMKEKYIKEGIFYVQTLGGSHKGRTEVTSKLKNSILEIKYSNGGITSTLGHPFSIAEPLAMGIHNPNQKQKRLDEIRQSRIAENDAYWFFDSLEDVDSKWQNLISTNPGVIKLMLFDAKNYNELNKDTLRIGKKGLSKEVAQYVVQKAKKASLRVFSHIETADDFNIAVDIGVDVIAHIPGYSWRGNDEDLGKYVLTNGDIKKAAQNNTTVITTASLSMRYLVEYINGKPQVSKEKLLKVAAYQKGVIKTLMDNGVDVALGADQYQKTVITEVEYVNKYEILNTDKILDILTRVNTQIIFPDRKIGEIKNGYEASFLVLKENPLESLDAIKNIELRVKNGDILN